MHALFWLSAAIVVYVYAGYPALLALWWAGRDQWDKAHQVVMDEGDTECAWVHAYLHRVEGDLGNASYWYRQAQRPVSTEPLPVEWAAIAKTLLEKGP